MLKRTVSLVFILLLVLVFLFPSVYSQATSEAQIIDENLKFLADESLNNILSGQQPLYGYYKIGSISNPEDKQGRLLNAIVKRTDGRIVAIGSSQDPAFQNKRIDWQ